ncbi:hypothetical protein IPO96_00255 [Candidatus Saccharibacteria bacterium]|nr:MAG: hypothetical protein IPO96_00255 [Candidatus Saccharibacteria bacterium]
MITIRPTSLTTPYGFKTSREFLETEEWVKMIRNTARDFPLSGSKETPLRVAGINSKRENFYAKQQIRNAGSAAAERASTISAELGMAMDPLSLGVIVGSVIESHSSDSISNNIVDGLRLNPSLNRINQVARGLGPVLVFKVAEACYLAACDQLA